MAKIVLQKFIAQSSCCSRRKAEEMIKNSKVQVNGRPAELGMKVDEKDDVRIYGKKILLSNDKIYIMLNKPAGYTCTNRKFPGEKNVFELLSTTNVKTNIGTTPGLSLRIKKLIIVGRLDKNSRGLVLLTNDGGLAQKLTHPKFEHEKEYIVVTGHCPATTDMIIKKLNNGIDIGEGDGIVKTKNINYLGNNKFKIILTQGKKRQIRRMFKALGCEVTGILKTRIGNLKLNDLPAGRWRFLNNEEIKKLKSV